jgi:hypothetical protein
MHREESIVRPKGAVNSAMGCSVADVQGLEAWDLGFSNPWKTLNLELMKSGKSPAWLGRAVILTADSGSATPFCPCLHDLPEYLRQAHGYSPGWVMRGHFPQITVVADVVSAAILIHIDPAHRLSGQGFGSGEGL